MPKPSTHGSMWTIHGAEYDLAPLMARVRACVRAACVQCTPCMYPHARVLCAVCVQDIVVENHLKVAKLMEQARTHARGEISLSKHRIASDHMHRFVPRLIWFVQTSQHRIACTASHRIACTASHRIICIGLYPDHCGEQKSRTFAPRYENVDKML